MGIGYTCLPFCSMLKLVAMNVAIDFKKMIFLFDFISIFFFNVIFVKKDNKDTGRVRIPPL